MGAGKLGYRPGLQGVRGVAITLVVLHHAFSWPRGGFLGVDLFFVLSGFLITTLLLEERATTGRISLLGFYERRARRLLPALFAMLAAYAAQQFALGHHPLLPVIEGVFYCTNFVLALTHQTDAVGNLWSLAAEEQFYLLWPVLLIGISRLRPEWLLRSLVVILVLANVHTMILLAGGASTDRIYFAPDTRSDGLVIGCILAAVRHGNSWRSISSRTVTLLAVLGAPILALFFVATATDPWPMHFEILAAALYFALIVHLASTETWLARALSVQPLVWLGEISYSLYLWHQPLLFTSKQSVHVEMTVLAVLIAAISYRYVEQPFRHRGPAALALPAPAIP